MNRRVFDQMVSGGPGDLSPGKVAMVLGSWAGQLGDIERVVLARYEVHLSAVALRDVFVGDHLAVQSIGP